MICEKCKKEENYDDDEEFLLVGVCGGCHKMTFCHKCIDEHQETCIGWQMVIKDQHILQ